MRCNGLCYGRRGGKAAKRAVVGSGGFGRAPHRLGQTVGDRRSLASGILRSRRDGGRATVPCAEVPSDEPVAWAAFPEDSDSSGVQQQGFPVQLRVYNIDRYGLAPIGAKLLKKDVDGIYHVGIAVHDTEYWFDHQVNRVDLADVTFAFGFGPAHVYEMGRTTMSKEEVEDFIFGQMKEVYNIETYDCFLHNCHHFANDVCVQMTGRRIPQWLIDHGEQGLSELSEENARVVRLVTNKIARIMMVSWGRYNKERFVKRKEDAHEGRAEAKSQLASKRSAAAAAAAAGDSVTDRSADDDSVDRPFRVV